MSFAVGVCGADYKAPLKLYHEPETGQLQSISEGLPYSSIHYMVTRCVSPTRNFGEADYEALLELDNQPAVARPQLSEAELGRLQTHIHHLKAEALPKRPPRLMPGSVSSCSDKVAQCSEAVCLQAHASSSPQLRACRLYPAAA